MMMTRSPVGGWSAGDVLRAPWCSQIPPPTTPPRQTSPPDEMPTCPPRETWRRRGAEPAWRRSAAPNSTMNVSAGIPRPGPPEGRSRRANLLRPHHHLPPSRAKEDGWSERPRECSCTKTFTFCLTFPLTYKVHDTQYMFKRHDHKLIIFAFMAVFVSYCPQFWDSGVIYKAHDTVYMFARHDRKLSFLRLWPFFRELLPTVLGFWANLKGP
jgi:hypothetical protein